MFPEQGTIVPPASQPNPAGPDLKVEYGDNRVLHYLSPQSLRVELQRRDEEITKPSCGSGGTKGSYNTALHVAALFIILILSTFGKAVLRHLVAVF